MIKPSHYLDINLTQQTLSHVVEGVIKKVYLVSTGLNGIGEEQGSGQTPRGWHQIRAKIGAGMPLNTVFVGRRPTGETFGPDSRLLYPNRDWILTRILWLSGLERGLNRGGKVDTMQRYIYIHGTPDDVMLGQPGSKGCVRMHNLDLMELFDAVPYRTLVYLHE